MLQHDKPEDFLIATGEIYSKKTHSHAFREAGIELKWEGEGVDKKV